MRERGFSIVEVLVALAIVTALLLGANAIAAQQRTVSQRLAAQRTADRALENGWERLRAGAWPLVDRVYAPLGAGDPTIAVTVSAGTVPGTWRVDLVATYRVAGAPFRRTLAGLVRP